MKKHEQNTNGEGGVDIFQEFQNRSYQLRILRRNLAELNSQLVVSGEVRRRAARRYLDRMVGTAALVPINSNGKEWSYWEDITLQLDIVPANSNNGRKQTDIKLPKIGPYGYGDHQDYSPAGFDTMPTLELPNGLNGQPVRLYYPPEECWPEK